MCDHKYIHVLHLFVFAQQTKTTAKLRFSPVGKLIKELQEECLVVVIVTVVHNQRIIPFKLLN